MDHLLTLEAKEANEFIKSITVKTYNEKEMAVHNDQKVWMESDMYTNLINDELLECQCILNVKDETEEEDNIIQPTTVCEPVQSPLQSPPPAVNIQVKKVATPKISIKTMNKPRRRMGRRPRPILPITIPIASASNSYQTSIQHQKIMPSPQIPRITYQISLGNNGQNLNNPVQYTMLQPQPVFLNSVLTQTSVTIPSSMVINQPYQLTQSQVLPSPKILNIASNILDETHCPFCNKLFKNIKEHVEECWANQDRKSYKFRKITPSTTV